MRKKSNPCGFPGKRRTHIDFLFLFSLKNIGHAKSEEFERYRMPGRFYTLGFNLSGNNRP